MSISAFFVFLCGIVHFIRNIINDFCHNQNIQFFAQIDLYAEKYHLMISLLIIGYIPSYIFNIFSPIFFEIHKISLINGTSYGLIFGLFPLIGYIFNVMYMIISGLITCCKDYRNEYEETILKNDEMI